MDSRLTLQYKLEELLESKEVYYQPPESIKITYPAIIYSHDGIFSTSSNDKKYVRRDKYLITVVSKLPDHPVVNKILDLPYTSYVREYRSNNLYHVVLSIQL